MQQAGTFSPLDTRVLALPAAGATLGLLAGILGGRAWRRRPAAAATAPSIPGYEVLGVLGRGDAGTTYLARQVNLGRLVALKQVARSLVQDPGFLSRIRSSAVLLTRLDHPNCAHVYALLEDRGQVYIASELIEGPSLRRVMEESGRLRPEQALQTLEGALDGLAQAHSLGLIHGGLKPENVILDHEGRSKLVDFGLTGGPAYMSPEQIHGQPADARSDLYAAGAILYELLTGKPPYVADDPLAIERMHLEAPVPSEAKTR
jgi:serine/threonine protein kinase